MHKARWPGAPIHARVLLLRAQEHRMAGLVRLSMMVMLAVSITLFTRETASAQEPTKPEMRENCPGLVASKAPSVMPASMRLALNPDQVRITYSGHSTFLVESPQLVRVATDYNDYVRPMVLPDIA